jgi:hypothetical protein
LLLLLVKIAFSSCVSNGFISRSFHEKQIVTQNLWRTDKFLLKQNSVREDSFERYGRPDS